jgi:hypothetical protein
MKRAPQSASSRIGKGISISGPGKLREVMVIAEEQGLLRGERNQVVRGRMPKALVAQAKKRTGVSLIPISSSWRWLTLRSLTTTLSG